MYLREALWVGLGQTGASVSQLCSESLHFLCFPGPFHFSCPSLHSSNLFILCTIDKLLKSTSKQDISEFASPITHSPEMLGYLIFIKRNSSYSQVNEEIENKTTELEIAPWLAGCNLLLSFTEKESFPCLLLEPPLSF